VLDPVSTFESDGFAVFRNVLDRPIMHDVQNHIEWLQAKYPENRDGHFSTELIADDPFWLRLVGDDRLLDIAEKFIGPDIALFASAYINKPPRDGRPVLWHQDGSYWPLEPMKVISLWLAVDDATPESGCVRVIPGSHRTGLKPFVDRLDVPNLLYTSLDERVDDRAAVDVILNSGDVAVLHPNLVHGSHGNISAKRRCGLTIRYIPTSTRITVEGWSSAFLLRGQGMPGTNDYRERPAFDPARHMPFTA
jgi:ectoine hydroxylase-related dioxygenase (phytanoyl-CoA dioxygenase family)